MTLFLIGNGFDLNCGMNTRFSDVYNMLIQIRNLLLLRHSKEKYHRIWIVGVVSRWRCVSMHNL